jgi:catechol 2,3-dioxygenase-like lactoylglutathione lyase family enzyme
MIDKAHAYSAFSVDDIAAARAFYAGTLGLEVADAPLGDPAAGVPTGLTLRLGAARVLIYPKPNHQPASYTCLYLPTDDIERAVDELAAKGVRFERYDGAIETDAKGIHRGRGVSPVAWFEDPAGNVIAVIQQDHRE